MIKRSLLWLSLCLSVPASTDELPDLGQGARTALPVYTERLLGDMIMSKIHAHHAVVSDLAINDYLSDLSDTLTHSLKDLDFPFHIFAISSPELNAFTFFGGHIAVHAGLLLASQTEGALAAVLAHEIAHIRQRHLARMVEKQQQLKPLVLAELLGAIALGALGAPQAGINTAMTAMAGHTQYLINFTRDHEQEADRIGLQIFAQAGFDPKEMYRMLEMLGHEHIYQDKPPEYLLTHPLYDSRIADIQNRVRQLPVPQKIRTDNIEFQLAQARMAVLSEPYSARAVKKFSSSKTVSMQYRYALALLRDHKPDQAYPLIQALIQIHPHQWILELSLAETEMRLNQTAVAQHRLEQLRQRYPAKLSILCQYAEVLLNTNRPQAVIRLLTQERRRFLQEPRLYQLLTQAYSTQKQWAEAHQAHAEWFALQGDFQNAFQQIDLGLAIAKETQNHRALMQLQVRQTALKEQFSQRLLITRQ
jgi:predicted Zn-dependent protease